MKDTVIPYTLPEVNDHSFFYIAQHVAPDLEAKMHRHEAWELYFVTHGKGVRMTGDADAFCRRRHSVDSAVDASLLGI